MTLEAKYKCRLCGEVFTDGVCERETARAVIMALTVKKDFNPAGSGIGVHRHNVHNCNDIEFGFSDFIGFGSSSYWWMSSDELADKRKTWVISDE